MYKKYSIKRGVPERCIHKILLIMRLTTVILIASLMQVSAAGLAQKVTLSKSNAELELVLKELRRQTGFNFVYTDLQISKSKPVNINVKEVPLELVLDEVFKDQPLVFAIDSKTVIIKEKKKSYLETVIARFQAIDVRGRVVDTLGNGLAGANVRVKNGKGAVVTSANGDFYLPKVDEGAVLVISYLGYLTREVAVNKDFNNIVLNQSSSALDVVEIQAYTSTTKRLSLANIATVKAEDIVKSPVQNVLLAIQGRVPGIVITQQNGYAGSGVKVQIQGQNSIDNGNDPLYVIDGVPYFSDLSNGDIGNQLIGGAKPLNFIDPLSIESIDILKDAAATSIYGSRAANGAILITTKKGKAGASKIDLNLQQGIGQVSRKADLLNTQQYLAMRKEAFKNDGLPVPNSSTIPDPSNYDLTVYDQDRYTDWQKVLVGGTAHYTSLNGNISGGSGNTTFLLGGTYKRQTAVIPDDFADQNGSLLLNLGNTSANQRFRINFSAGYQLDDNNIINRNLMNDALHLVPNAPALYTADGKLNWEPIQSGINTISTWFNPLRYLNSKFVSKTSGLNSNLSLGYELMEGLTLKTVFGYTRLNSENKLLNYQEVTPPEYRNVYSRSSIFSYNSNQSYSISPQLSYKGQVGKGLLSLLIAAELQGNKTFGQQLTGYGYSSDLILENISAAPFKFASTTAASQYRYNALFGVAGYNWQDQYLAELSIRRDGSSRFGAENQFHNFGNLAIGWVFSKAEFLKNSLSWLSFGKLRASYGTTGNDGIGNYRFLSAYESVSAAVPYQGIVSSYPSRISNPYLQWEETRKLNVGLDLGFAKDRVLINVNFYRNRSSNQLLSYALPATAGFGGVDLNFPAVVQNSGIELELNTVNIQSRAFTWSSSFNLSIPRNKLIAFPDLETSSYANQLVVGQRLSVKSGLYVPYEGVDPATGLYRFRKADGSLSSGNLSYPEDYTGVANLDPRFYGGLSNTLRYKGWSLYFLLSFNKQTKIGGTTGGFLSPGFSGGDGQGNQWVDALNNPWRARGDQAETRKYGTAPFPDDYVLLGVSSKFVQDASFIRLRNVSLSCQFPKPWMDKLRIQQARIFMQGQNLLTITRYKGLDPETGDSALPPLRLMTMGVQLTF
ncbi:MAG: SusC/RagA family TonB-linked outer membrane protein [Candidatus Pedobacter colombiensis]|uniref:SusC/RagA family TonB-linked outer membrane protein n=1 Tax=Candidatus Pedobacter colombiensis TaxID=3121371 RepID=A0AAJ5W877_9SPHI|nr:SusC/RagA family TonB-linked outer membrane protein [Pedobacter sp.]WEK20408.1 MAG: SusC/RagA family TonB-linked outer membrane protein [Pedobacter sp.]